MGKFGRLFLHCVSRVFQAPERFTLELLKFLTTFFVKFPRTTIFIYSFLIICFILIGAFGFERQWVNASAAYKPKFSLERGRLDNKITQNYLGYLETTRNNRNRRAVYSGVEYFDFYVLFYDVKLSSSQDKMNFALSLRDFCEFITTQKVDGLVDYDKINFYDIWSLTVSKQTPIPNICKDVEKYSSILDLESSEAFAPLIEKVAPSLLKKYVGQHLLEDANFSSYIPSVPFTFMVPNTENGTQWQLAILEELQGEMKRIEEEYGVKVVCTSKAYMNGDERRTVTSEIAKVIASVLVVVTATMVISVNIGKFEYSRLSMALTAVVMSVVAVVAGLAAGNILRLPYITLLAFIPFLIIGIGIDSAFLLLHQWLLSIESGLCKTPAELITSTVQGCFLSVTLSDFTAITAFAVGCLTSFEAVKLCCSYLALSVFLLWLTELFFFIPCLSIKSTNLLKSQSKSQKDRNLSNVEHFSLDKEPKSSIVIDEKTEIISLNRRASTVCKIDKEAPLWNRFKIFLCEKAKKPKNAESGLTQNELFNLYEQVLMRFATFLVSKTWLRLLWIVAFCLLTLVSGYNVSKMQSYEDKSKFLVDWSYTRHYLVKLVQYVPVVERNTEVIFTSPLASQESDWLPLVANRKFLTSIQQLKEDIKNEEVLSGFTDWPECFEKEVLNYEKKLSKIQTNTDSFGEAEQIENYNTLTANFVKKCRRYVQYDIRFRNTSYEIEGKLMEFLQIYRIKCELRRRWINNGDVPKEKEVLDVLFRLEEKHEEIDLMFYDYNIGIMWRDINIHESLWHSVAYAGACCFVMVTLFIPHLLLIVCVLLMTGLTFLHILGSMALLGMTYCTQTYVVSLIAMGMSIDYVAHSGRCFFSASRRNKTNQKAVLSDTLTEISVPLTNSALTTIMGISLLAFADSQTFRDIGYSVMAIFAHSYFNSCFVLPTCLYYFSKLSRHFCKSTREATPQITVTLNSSSV